jgi:AAA15 family ATPase/GTPase
VDAELFEVHTFHQTDEADAPVKFNLDRDESNGTRRFFALAGPILDGLDQGATLVVDELECSIHPLLARKLIELFQNPSVNTHGAQLIFATHDSTLMDLSLFRRDQIWITNKRSNGSTELYSLHDIEDRPRNNEAAQKNYLDGRYGGVPRFGPSFEDLEVS